MIGGRIGRVIMAATSAMAGRARAVAGAAIVAAVAGGQASDTLLAKDVALPSGVAEVEQQSWSSTWSRRLSWTPTSYKELQSAEDGLLKLLRTPYVKRNVDIGPDRHRELSTSGRPERSGLSCSSSSSHLPLGKARYLNTISFENEQEGSPPLVCVHGYGAGLGFFFRNFDTLANRFQVHALDLLGWGLSARPDFPCKTTEDTEAWFLDSLEEWRKSMGLEKMILMGHSLGGYLSFLYALQYPERVEHLILVGPAGFGSPPQRLQEFRSTWKGAIANWVWEKNITPQTVIRTFGRWGPGLVRKYTGVRFGTRSQGDQLTEMESQLFTAYLYHTIAAKRSGELCLRHIFSLGAFPRIPLVDRAVNLNIPTTFIYGEDDWMDWRGGERACRVMKGSGEVLRIPRGGHYVFLDNSAGFHAAVFHACKPYLRPQAVEEDAVAPAVPANNEPSFFKGERRYDDLPEEGEERFWPKKVRGLIK